MLQNEFTSLIPSSMTFQEFVILDEGCEITRNDACENDYKDEENTNELDHPAAPTSHKEAWNILHDILVIKVCQLSPFFIG